MSKSIKSVLALSLVVFVAACAQQQSSEPEYVEPIMPEPVSNKY